MKPLSILAYFDGRPGHEKQTRGILNGLAMMTPTEVRQIKVPVSRSAYIRNWVAYCVSSLQRQQAAECSGPVDLIIGTGTHTHIPMLLQKKKQGTTAGQPVRVVTCMTPDRQLLSRFDLCCIPAHDGPAPRDNVFVTLGPPNPVVYTGDHESGRGLILVGGVDRKSHVWNSAGIVSQIRTIIEKNPAMQWTVSSSPRTPEETSRNLEDMEQTVQQLSFFRAEETPAGWVEEHYARCRIVWVTADSVSMVYEALTAGCSVGILPVQWLHPVNKFEKSLHSLAAKKMIVDFAAWQAGMPMPAPAGAPFNEALRCAREILQRWWPERATAGSKL